ncbi:hypothetical protein, partial [Nocardia farcinica]|uniref:hypothetical protein n=1 Tax=Nocardia farcinica TaxID=37329 RepID=UPI002455B3E6
FITVNADVPGRYDWTVYINGAAPEGPQWNVEDDNLHSAFRRYRDGVTRYHSGYVSMSRRPMPPAGICM